MTDAELAAEVINLDTIWDLAVEAGLDACFPSDVTGFGGDEWGRHFDKYASLCNGRQRGTVPLIVSRLDTGEKQVWVALIERYTPKWDERLPIPYVVRGFEQVE